MLMAALQLIEDFLSTIIFLLAFALSGSMPVAIGVAIAAAVAQFVILKIRGRALDLMQWMSLGLVVGLGAVALLTRDARFVLIKPALIHFIIAAVMLRRGWLIRYLPPALRERVPESVLVVSGYAWAGLMAAIGLAILVIAAAFSFAVWAWFVGVGVIGLQIAAFLLQYLVFRLAITRSRAAQAPVAAGPASK